MKNQKKFKLSQSQLKREKQTKIEKKLRRKKPMKNDTNVINANSNVVGQMVWLYTNENIRVKNHFNVINALFHAYDQGA